VGNGDSGRCARSWQPDDTPLERFAPKKLRRKLKPIFKTSVHRITLPVRTKQSEIELAIDLGSIIAGRRSNPIKELELELKSGRLTDLFRVANRSFRGGLFSVFPPRIQIRRRS
jgi:inorganic triphosphatase YgiF